jgi:hypothetical protein
VRVNPVIVPAIPAFCLEKLVSRLRRKADGDATEPTLIHTRRGFGYWLGAGSCRVAGGSRRGGD